MPTLSFRLGDHRFELHPTDYVLHHENLKEEKTQTGTASCAIALQALDVSSDDKALWVFGDVFLRCVYIYIPNRDAQARPRTYLVSLFSPVCPLRPLRALSAHLRLPRGVSLSPRVVSLCPRRVSLSPWGVSLCPLYPCPLLPEPWSLQPPPHPPSFGPPCAANSTRSSTSTSGALALL